MENKQSVKPSWQELQERKINMAKKRGARVLKVHSPLGTTMFDILRQFDMAYTHFKARLGEMDGISHEEGEELMTEGREIVMAFSDYTARLSKRMRFCYYTPREIKAFVETEKEGESE